MNVFILTCVKCSSFKEEYLGVTAAKSAADWHNRTVHNKSRYARWKKKNAD